MVSAEQRSKIKQDVNILLGNNPDAEFAAKDDFIIDTVIDECLAFCNRSDIPHDMERVVARIAARVCNDGLDKQTGVQQYRELDMQVTYNLDADAFGEKNMLQRWVSLSTIKGSEKNECDNILERHCQC